MIHTSNRLVVPIMDYVTGAEVEKLMDTVIKTTVPFARRCTFSEIVEERNEDEFTVAMMSRRRKLRR